MKKRTRSVSRHFRRGLTWPRWAAPWKRHILIGAASVLTVLVIVLLVVYVQYSREIDVRLHGERDRVVPRVFARPVTLESGLPVTMNEVI